MTKRYTHTHKKMYTHTRTYIKCIHTTGRRDTHTHTHTLIRIYTHKHQTYVYTQDGEIHTHKYTLPHVQKYIIIH